MTQAQEDQLNKELMEEIFGRGSGDPDMSGIYPGQED